MKNGAKNIVDSKSLESQGRRKAVKTIVGGVTALAAYNVLPSRWGTPIIESIFLPAHAQTSGEIVEAPAEAPVAPGISYPISSSPTALSATNNETDTGDDIYITFDGAANLSLVLAGDLDPTPANALIGVDTDPGNLTTWESYSSGSNWSISDNGGIIINGGPNSSGTYTIIVDGFGSQFSLTFSVAVSGPGDPTATVSGASIQPT